MPRERPLFTPRRLSNPNQIRVTLFLGMASILMPLLLASSRADPSAMAIPSAADSEPAAPPSNPDPDAGSEPIDDGAFHSSAGESPMVARLGENECFSSVALESPAP